MTACEHPGGERFRVCRHLHAGPQDLGYAERFTGRGREIEYVCKLCYEAPAAELVDACTACREQLESWEGIVGKPQIVDEDRGIWFEPRRIALAVPELVDVQPVGTAERALWMGVTREGEVLQLDLDRGVSEVVARANAPYGQPMLRVSRDGMFVAVVERKGTLGVVFERATGRSLPLERENYHAQQCTFPIAFVSRGERQLLVWAPTWNRLDIIDARTSEIVTQRASPQWTDRNERPAHYLDYFHAGIVLSPDERWIADNGWMWAPQGAVVTWSVDRWLENAWESEDGASKRMLCYRDYYWDGPLAWIDNTRLAVYGYGLDDEWLVPAVRMFDVTTGNELGWFPGPRGELACDRELYSVDADGVAVWDIARGTRIARAAVRGRWHPGTRSFLSLEDGVVEHVPRGHDSTLAIGHVGDLAARIAREQSFEDLHVLGDALESAGCTDAGMIAHCHAPHRGVQRCWVIERLRRAG